MESSWEAEAIWLLTSFDYEDSNKLLLIYTVKKIHMNQRHRDLYDVVMKISCLQVEELRDRIRRRAHFSIQTSSAVTPRELCIIVKLIAGNLKRGTDSSK